MVQTRGAVPAPCMPSPAGRQGRAGQALAVTVVESRGSGGQAAVQKKIPGDTVRAGGDRQAMQSYGRGPGWRGW
jgi:hypothetical protein